MRRDVPGHDDPSPPRRARYSTDLGRIDLPEFAVGFIQRCFDPALQRGEALIIFLVLCNLLGRCNRRRSPAPRRWPAIRVTAKSGC